MLNIAPIPRLYSRYECLNKNGVHRFYGISQSPTSIVSYQGLLNSNLKTLINGKFTRTRSFLHTLCM